MNTKKGFTLVEILIVVVILGILAAIVLPRFSNASDTARASMMADDLRVLRIQILVYKSQHCGSAPGYPLTGSTPTEAEFVSQMTNKTDATGAIAADGKYGPYMRELPPNPINNKNSVEIADESVSRFTADDSHGWIYQPSTLTLKSDAKGADDTGKAFIDY